MLFSVLGIILIILRRLPDASQLPEEKEIPEHSHLKLRQKGLPAVAASKVKTLAKLLIIKVWNFALEAKDLKPASAAGYRIKKFFGQRFHHSLPGQNQFNFNGEPRPVYNEEYCLDLIKRNPKNLDAYDNLGKFYLEQANFSDARDIYLYLTNHEAGNPDYQAKLGQCCFRLKIFEQAVLHYSKSVAIDTTQPNRYYNLGLSLEANGNTEQAIEAINKAIDMEPDNIKYYLGLSLCQQKLGLLEQAKATLNLALTKDPENEQVKKRLELLG